MPIRSEVLAAAILKRLGVPIAGVRAVTLSCEAQGVATVLVEHHAPESLLELFEAPKSLEELLPEEPPVMLLLAATGERIFDDQDGTDGEFRNTERTYRALRAHLLEASKPSRPTGRRGESPEHSD